MTQANGTFEVKVTPQAPSPDDDSAIGRLVLDKQFHGNLEATSRGEMLAVGTDVEGSAGYVALERVRGTLDGRHGTFAMQHIGTMTRGVPSLIVRIVPDSGTGELTGLAGTMNIIIAGGAHSYELEYTLP